MSKTAILTIAPAVLMLWIAPFAMAIPDSNAIVQEDIEYYIQTDKSIYDFGEDVGILFKVTNLRSEEWEFFYMGPVLDIMVAPAEENSDAVWFWSWDKIWPGPAVRRLQPGESLEINVIWPQIDLNDSWEIEDDFQVLPGVYGIGGTIGSSGFNDVISDALVTLEITIIPEPATLFFLALGAAFLRKPEK